MKDSVNLLEVYIEAGQKRTFAGAVEWPGWCRSGRSDEEALQALVVYGQRYAKVMKLAGLAFDPPAGAAAFQVVERLPGGSGTDFGAPTEAPSADSRQVSLQDLERFHLVLKACWEQFALALQNAGGKELRTGPRGGGRDPQKMLEHVWMAHSAYLSQLGWAEKPDLPGDLTASLERINETDREAVQAWARGELPAAGPRGGKRWSARYFTRRAAWHLLDHAWEVEDRTLP